VLVSLFQLAPHLSWSVRFDKSLLILVIDSEIVHHHATKHITAFCCMTEIGNGKDIKCVWVMDFEIKNDTEQTR